MESEQDERLKLALAITKAINNEEFSSIKTFMEKFYKRSLSEKNKIKLDTINRFNALLYKVNNQFSQLLLDDLKILFNVLFCFITKISGFLKQKQIHSSYNQKIRLFTATYHWTGQLLVCSANSKLGIQFVYQVLNWCLKNKQLKFPKLEQFQQSLQKSPYFNQIHLNQEQQSKGNQVKIKDFIIEQQQLSYSILKSINIQNLLQGLIINSDNLICVFDYFLLLSKKDGLIQGSKFKLFNKLFIQNFNSEKKINNEYLKFLKYSIQKGQFYFSNQNIIEKQIKKISKLFVENRNKMDENIDNMIIQQSNMDPIFSLPDISKQPVEILVNNFVSSSNPSFKQLYAILKSNQLIPKVVWKYFLQTVPMNNAKGIILSLMIVQSKKGISSDLLKFYQGIQNPKQDQKIGMMFILHLSLQQHPIECDLITNIIANIKENQLLDDCKFQFLPQQPIQKLKTTKQQKIQIQELLNTKFEPSEKLQHMFKVKIDLTSLIGDNVPFLNSLQKVNEITSKTLEQIIQYLPLERSQQIFEVILMRVNHLMKHKYVEQVSDKTLDWVTKSFSNYYIKFGKLIKEYLHSINKQNYLQLILSLKMHNLSRDSISSASTLSIPEFTNLFKHDPFLKLKGQEYSSYLIHVQNITSYQGQCDKIWNHMNQLIKFIRLIDEKNHSKKQVKKLLDKISYPTIYIVQSIYYSMKNNILNKQLISKMIGLLETNYDVFQIAETKANQLDLQYYQIDQLFDYLLSICYEETVNFICALLKNNGVIKQEKVSKTKKGGNKKGTKSQVSSQLEPNKIIKSLIACFPILLNQPNRLKDLSKITQIVEKLIHHVTKTEQKDFINCIVCWTIQFDTLTFNSFNQMLSRTKSLKQFWIKVHPMLKGNLNNKQIQDQFKYFSNLLTKSKIYYTQPNYDTLQHQLLSILQLVFSLQNIQNGTNIKRVQPQKVYSIFEANKKKHQDGNYFFCEDCDKNICEGCYHFMHRNHDVNFVIKQKGHCAHELQDKRNKPPNNNNLSGGFIGNINDSARKPHKFIQKFSNYSNFEDLDQLMRQQLNADLHFEKMALIQKAMKQKKEKFFQHIIQRQKQHSFVFGRDNPVSYEISYSQSNPPVPSINNLFQPSLIQPQIESAPMNEKQKQEEENQEQFQIKSQTQKSIIEINTKNNNFLQNIVFKTENKNEEQTCTINIDMNDLLKQLINDIPNTKLVGAQDGNEGLPHCLQKFNFQINPKVNVEQGQDKYTMMRVNISRLGGARYDLIDGDERGDRKFKVNTNLKMFITSNQKIIAIAHGSSITFIQQQPVRKIFKKRQKARKFNDIDNQDTYRFQKKMDVPFQILDISFSQINPNYLCVLNTNQINIINTNNNSHRDYKKIAYSFQNDGDTAVSAVRFSWLPYESNKIVIQIGTNLKIFQFKQQQFSSNKPLNLIKNIAVNRVIDSYQIRYNIVTNTYCCFVIDIQGQIYTQKFKLTSQYLEQFKLNLVEHKDKLNCFMISERSDIGFVSFKDGSNIFMKVQDTEIISQLNFKFSKLQNLTNQSQDILNKYGHCIYCVKQIFSSKQMVVLGCILRKQINGQTSGNFAIIEIFGQNNINLYVMNDGLKTQNFEVINYEDDVNRNKFILTGIQTDGYLWMKTYEVKKFNNRSNNLDNLIDDKIQIHNKQIINILNLEFGQQRTLEFKEDSKLQSLELNSNTNINSLNLPLIKGSCFITGISLRVEAVGKIKIKIFDSEFQFNVKKPRQLQIPLSLKESILSYIHKKIVLQITEVLKLNGTLQLYGTTFDKQSQLKQIYKQLVFISSFDVNYDSSDISNYFNNSSRLDFCNVSLDNMLTTLKKENLDLHEINFVLKLELLVQAIEKGSIILSPKSLEQFIDKSKKYIWIDRPCISTSIQRMFKKIFGIYKKLSENSGKSIMLGDAYDYHTFRDTLLIEKYFKQFLSNLCYTTFEQLVNYLVKMRIRRICNLYLMFALFPTMVWRLTNYLSVELQKITTDNNKKKTGDRLISMIALICEYFQYLKNKNKSGEKQTFKLMQMLLSGISKNKQLFKELIMRSFEYLETIPLKKQIDLSYGCKLFSIGVPIQLQQQHHHLEMLSQVFEQQKQSQQQQAEMGFDEDYESIYIAPERTLSAQIINNITKQCKVDDGTRILRQNRQSSQFTVIYYDIVYHLVVGLFENNIIKAQTNNFYIGLIFNLLNLLDLRIFKYSTKKKMIQSWLDVINKQLTNKQSSALFLVLSHFLEPNYSYFTDHKNQQTPKLRDIIVEYYLKNPNKLPFKQLFNIYISSGIEKTIKLKQALSSNQIVCNSIIYQLKYLGNLYLNLISSKIETKNLDPQIREFILKIYVKKKLRVYRNIIILEGWMDDLQQMKYCVAFQNISHGDIDIGLQRLLDTIKQKPQTLVNVLNKNQNYLQTLEDLLDRDIQLQHKSQIINIVNEYYNRA